MYINVNSNHAQTLKSKYQAYHQTKKTSEITSRFTKKPLKKMIFVMIWIIPKKRLLIPKASNKRKRRGIIAWFNPSDSANVKMKYMSPAFFHLPTPSTKYSTRTQLNKINAVACIIWVQSYLLLILPHCILLQQVWEMACYMYLGSVDGVLAHHTC